jgi:hypothetical protein
MFELGHEEICCSRLSGLEKPATMFGHSSSTPHQHNNENSSSRKHTGFVHIKKIKSSLNKKTTINIRVNPKVSQPK